MDQTPAPLDAHDLMAGMPTVESVRQLEGMLMDMPQVDLQTSHVVFGGMCARTIFIPAGTLLTGALTNLDNICVVQGDITVTTDEGPVRLTGFHVLPANKGAKRAGLAHADTWWSCLVRTDQNDIAAIEEEMTSESALLQTRTLYLEGASNPLIEGNSV